jgi:hypothetical protein
VATAMTDKKVADMAATKESTTTKKAAEVVEVKKAAEEAADKEAAEAAAMKKAAEEAAARANAEKAFNSTPALGAGTKRAATSMSGSSPPAKQYHDT